MNGKKSIKGLPLHSSAPYFKVMDIFGIEVNSQAILEEYRGILIDFFRGAF